MVVMTRWRSSLAGLVLALILVAGLACSPADTALPLSSAESAETLGGQPLETATERVAGSSSLGLSDAYGLGSFPAFMPPVAIGTDTQKCQLGTDPYSTCI